VGFREPTQVDFRRVRSIREGIESGELRFGVRLCSLRGWYGGWSAWDHAVDAPATQDVPAWEGKGLAATGGYVPLGSLREVPQSPFVAVASDGEGCGLLAFGQVRTAISHPEIRRIPEAPSGRPLACSLQRRC
jgi:hypothetical protein